MLQFETLPASFAALLAVLRPCFTAPSFATFTTLVAGMIAQPGRRTITGMLIGAGVSAVWHHSRAYWFFTRARWCPDTLGSAVLRLVVDRLIAPDQPIFVAVDDTLFRRSGRKVAAAAWHHDGSAKTKGSRAGQVAWGNNWVIAAVLVRLPFGERAFALPVGFALWTTGGPTKQAIACRLVTAIAAAHPGRQVHVVADAWYAGADGAPGAGHPQHGPRDRGLPAGVTLTSRLRANAALNAIAVPVPGKPGRPKRIGDKIGTPQHLAARADTTWTPTTVHRYRRTDTVHTADIRCLWYGVYRSREVRVILVREPATTAPAGYDLALITTDPSSPTADIVARYADRWSIEVAIEDAKQITGAGQAHNRTPTAVARTVPFALIVQTLTVCWYTLHGHPRDTITERRAQAPWYRSKTQPAYQDMIIKLRRTLIAARFRGGRARHPSPEETLAVQLAWADAAA